MLFISGLSLLSFATHFWMILVAVSLVGRIIYFSPRSFSVCLFRFWRKRIGAVHFSNWAGKCNWSTSSSSYRSSIRSVLYHLVCHSWFLGIWVLVRSLYGQNHLSLRASKKIVTEEFVPLSKEKSKFLSDFVVADIF
jgi:hypothetical protein